jgi:hypothetical protein
MASSVRKSTNTACELPLQDIFFRFPSSEERRGTDANRGLAWADGVTTLPRGHHGLIEVDTGLTPVLARRHAAASGARHRSMEGGCLGACGRARSETQALTSLSARPRWAQLRGPQR